MMRSSPRLQFAVQRCSAASACLQRGLRLWVFACCLMLLQAGQRNASAQDYQLVEPTGVVTADVYMRRGQMVVDDANGRQYVFDRDRSFDSFDGQYAGYFLGGVNRVVRFPRSGSGRLQVSDLDDVIPRFVFSRRSVRRFHGHVAGHPGGFPIHGGSFFPPVFPSPYHSPYGFPGYGYGYSYGYLNFGPALRVGGFGPGIQQLPYRPYVAMQSITLDSSVVARAPLPPVTVNLMNNAAREIRVTVTDRMAPDQSTRIRIAPGASESLLVQRDAGADWVRRVLTFAPDGSQITREITTAIAPVARYELVVHEWRLQSVAIDRTGKSPNVIEDTQFQGRGLGRFELPPGDQFSGGVIDVVQTALQSGNQGTVAPLLDGDNGNGDSPGGLRALSPLEEMILKQRQSQGR